jgi:hypothetical protein
VDVANSVTSERGPADASRSFVRVVHVPPNAGPPSIGVLCPEANSIVCDRVGIGVRVDVRAVLVIAPGLTWRATTPGNRSTRSQTEFRLEL